MSSRDHCRQWENSLIELIGRASCDLPADIETALKKNLLCEGDGSHAREMIKAILENVKRARLARTPICQDTGTLNFFLGIPPEYDPVWLRRRIERAVVKATAKGFLRRNTLSFDGRSLDNNLGAGSPVFHFEPRRSSKRVAVRLLMKGGGCENCSCQYSLPDENLAAGRDLEGVRRCVLDAVWRAQGRGCAPGLLGVCVGGDRAAGALEAKRQLLRPLGDSASDFRLDALEQRLFRESGTLGIGPMGMGGKTTVLGVKIGALTRLPASYFVSVAYMCWACRRRGIEISSDGQIERWLK